MKRSNRIVFVMFAVFVALVSAAQARSATLPISAGVAAKVCPVVERRLEHSGALRLRYVGRTVKPRAVWCRFIATDLRAPIIVKAIRFSRCTYRYSTYVGTRLVSTINQTERAWCA